MIHVQCPAEWHKLENGFFGDLGKSLFLGGGITSCPLWQPVMVDLLKDTDLILLNPRREVFDIEANPNLPREQIEWEYRYLQSVTARMFWFPCETLCPITLFELGKYLHTQDLFVGCHPNYGRRLDLEVQLRLARPGMPPIHLSLESLAEAIKVWASR